MFTGLSAIEVQIVIFMAFVFMFFYELGGEETPFPKHMTDTDMTLFAQNMLYDLKTKYPNKPICAVDYVELSTPPDADPARLRVRSGGNKDLNYYFPGSWTSESCDVNSDAYQNAMKTIAVMARRRWLI